MCLQWHFAVRQNNNFITCNNNSSTHLPHRPPHNDIERDISIDFRTLMSWFSLFWVATITATGPLKASSSSSYSYSLFVTWTAHSRHNKHEVLLLGRVPRVDVKPAYLQDSLLRQIVDWATVKVGIGQYVLL